MKIKEPKTGYKHNYDNFKCDITLYLNNHIVFKKSNLTYIV